MIEGTEPFDNYNAGLAYTHLIEKARKLTEEWFAKHSETPMQEPGVVGYIMALRGMAQVDPALSRAGRLHPNQAVRWKAAFETWIEQFGSQVKVKRGVDRGEMWEKALREFDLLKEVLDSAFKKNGSRD